MEEEHGNRDHIPGTFNQVMMSHLDRLTSGIESLQNIDGFGSVLVQVSQAMYPLFGEAAQLPPLK